MIKEDVAPEEAVKTVTSRLKWSKEYHRPRHEKFVRYYKIWRNIADAVSGLSKEESEEPNSFIPYAFSIVEDLHARAVDPMLKIGLPARPQARNAAKAKSAENFGNMARTHFTSPLYGLEFMSGGKERVITGTMWEKDTWANEWAVHRRWARVPKVVEVKTEEAPGVPATGVGEAVAYVWKEVSERVPERVGYATEFPSVFLVHPEPGIKQVRRLQWLVEECPSVPLADLQAETYRDPETGQQMPVYDLTKLLELEKGGDPKRVIKPTDPMGTEYPDFYEQSRRLVASEDTKSTDHAGEDGMDRVHIAKHYGKNGIVHVVAQGKYLIAVIKNPVSRIPFRTRVYTLDPQFLHGIGAIEPIEDLVYELNDIHNLSFSNWLRIINRMMAVNVSALVDEDELESNPYGPLRFKGNVHQAIAFPQAQDVSPSMLTMESNSKGLMERAVQAADFSPGVKGTKQSHDTATGVLEIQNAMSARLNIMRRIDMAAFQDQMWMMEKLYSYHLWDPMPFMAYGPDGSTSSVDLANVDIDTDGKGFDFIIEYDPSFGDDAIQRNQQMTYFDLALKYENWRTGTNQPPDVPQIQMGEIFANLSRNFGYEDTSLVLKRPDGTMDPDTEVQVMMGGGMVRVNPDENLVAHLIRHQQQRPMVEQAVAAKKVPPEVLAALDQHMVETTMAIQQIMKNPQAAAMMYKAREVMKQGAGAAGMGGEDGLASA